MAKRVDGVNASASERSSGAELCGLSVVQMCIYMHGKQKEIMKHVPGLMSSTNLRAVSHVRR